jgi:hypothetical protein
MWHIREREEVHTELWQRNLKVRDRSEDAGSSEGSNKLSGFTKYRKFFASCGTTPYLLLKNTLLHGACWLAG